MSVLLLALISLGISSGLVLSSFLWWANFAAPTPTSPVNAEARGFPVHYYSTITTYRWIPQNSSYVPITTVQDLDLQTLTVDIIVIFILGLGILTVWRWRALGKSGRSNRRRFST